MGGQRERGDHDHEVIRGQRRPQRPVPRPARQSQSTTAAFVEQDTTTEGNWIGTYGRRATTSSATRPAFPATPPSRPRGRRPTPGPPARPTRGPSRLPAARAASPPAGTRQHELHGGREPDRRPDARPGAVLPRLGQRRSRSEQVPDQQRHHGSGAEYRDDLVVLTRAST